MTRIGCADQLRLLAYGPGWAALCALGCRFPALLRGSIDIRRQWQYFAGMSLAEILAEIPKLSFVERQELVQHVAAVDDELTPEESAILDARMDDFHQNPEAGIPLEMLRESVRDRLRQR